MARSVRRWVAAITLAGGSLAAAQPWPPVTPVPGVEKNPGAEKNPVADEPLFVIRTAGQADRIVRVVHPATEPDGLAEVKDTASGQTFNIPGKVLATLPRANVTRSEPAPVPKAELRPQPAEAPVKPLPQLPVNPVRPVKLETAERLSPQPYTITPPPGEKMVVTWRADVPPAVPPTKPAPATTTTADPWRAAGPEQPPVAPPPKPAPVPTWKPTNPPKSKVDPNDPWRPSGG